MLRPDSTGLLYPTRSTSEVQLDVELASSEARVTEGADESSGEPCVLPTIEVDVRVAVASVDGALAAQLDGRLTLETDTAYLSATMPAAAVGESFAFDSADVGGILPRI